MFLKYCKEFNTKTADMRELLNSLTVNALTFEICIRIAILLASFFLYSRCSRIIHLKDGGNVNGVRRTKYAKILKTIYFACILHLTFFIILKYYSKTQNDIRHGISAITLAVPLSLFFTAFLKYMIGPMSNLVYIYYPNGEMIEGNVRTLRLKYIAKEQISFPCGLSSLSFTLMTFATLYLAGKLNLFNPNEFGQSWRLCICTIPTIIAAGISISSPCNCRHYFANIIAGAIIGIIFGYICYRQHFPSVFDLIPDEPYEF